MSYRIIEHTADLAIESEGETPEEFYRSLLEGVYELLTGEQMSKRTVGESGELIPVEEKEIEVWGDDPEERVVSLVNEFLFRVQNEGWVPTEINRVEVEGNEVRVGMRVKLFKGVTLLIREIKAATYHLLKVEQNPRWKARLILDV